MHFTIRTLAILFTTRPASQLEERILKSSFVRFAKFHLYDEVLP